MTDRRNAGSEASTMDLPIEDVIEIQGDAMPDEQDAVLSPDEIEHERTLSRTELDHGMPSPDPTIADPAAGLDGLDLDDLRDGETDDPIAATEEGLVYVPPIDPPVIADPDARDGIVIAAGPAVSAGSDPYDDDHRGTDLTSESDLTQRIHDALRADAATTAYADRLVIGTVGSTAVIRGVVADIDDSDLIAEVVERVAGIEEVVDETVLEDG